MRPQPAAVIAGSARRMQRNGVVRLMSSMRCQSASVIRADGCRRTGAGVGDQDPDRPPRVLDRGEQAADGAVGEQIDGQDERLAAEVSRRPLVSWSPLRAHNATGCPCIGEPACDGRADAAPGAGDKAHPAVVVHGPNPSGAGAAGPRTLDMAGSLACRSTRSTAPTSCSRYHYSPANKDPDLGATARRRSGTPQRCFETGRDHVGVATGPRHRVVPQRHVAHLQVTAPV